MKLIISKILTLLCVGTWILSTSAVQAQILPNGQDVEQFIKDSFAYAPPTLFKAEFGTNTNVTSSSPLINPYCLLGSGGPPCFSVAEVDLPDGVSIEGYELNFGDNDAVNDAGCVFGYIPHDALQTGDPAVSVAQYQTMGTPGAASSGVVAPLMPHIVDNKANIYGEFCIMAGGGTVVATTKIHWTRMISPAPGVATYSDVPPSHPFYNAVEAMSASGVTGGCGGGNYCPDDSVTRGQMAAFIARALGL